MNSPVEKIPLFSCAGEAQRHGDPRHRLIAALDVPSIKEATALAKKLDDHVGGFKIGLELICLMIAELISLAPATEDKRVVLSEDGALQDILQFLAIIRGRTMFDVKMHDIPETMRRAAERLAGAAQGVTVHLSAGPTALSMTQTGVRTTVRGPKTIGVSVLTSLDDRQTRIVYGSNVAGQFVRLMTMLEDMPQTERPDAIVCSPVEAGVLKMFAPHAIAVTPNIRRNQLEKDDQNADRAAGPGQAVQRGSDFLVVGRPFREAGDPAAEAEAFAAEIIKVCGHA